MPLPKAPTRKAAAVDPAAYDVQATPSSLGKRTTGPAAERVNTALEWRDTSPATAAPSREAAVAAERALAAAGAAVANAAATATATPSAHVHPAPARSARKRADRGVAKLFVLDTNVLMHDPTCLFRFEEHDIYLPMITLEELDGHKKGMSEVARNVRQVSRELDVLAAADGLANPKEGIPLNKTGHREAEGKLFFQTQLIDTPLPQGLPQGKADNQILGVVQALKGLHPGREVVLVSKDINMRIKARALGLPAEDYRNDKTLEDSDLLYTGVQALPSDFWERHGKTMESWQQGGTTFYRISGPLVPTLLFFRLAASESSSRLTWRTLRATSVMPFLCPSSSSSVIMGR